jgi:sec-independent protein translocase protein TatC
VITPPDGVSQVLLALPMVLLYEVGLVVARWLAPRADTG